MICCWFGNSEMVTLRHLCVGPEPAKDTWQVGRLGESPSEVPWAANQETSVLVLLYLWSCVICVCVIFTTLNPAPLSPYCTFHGVYPVQVTRNNRELSTAPPVEESMWWVRRAHKKSNGPTVTLHAAWGRNKRCLSWIIRNESVSR